MWKRFIRALRSLFGFGVAQLENPKLILQQNIRDMQDQVPRMNESIAMVRANVTLLERENATYKAETADLTAKIKSAIQANREDIAGNYATQLQHKKEALQRNEGQLMLAKTAYDKAMEVKKAFLKTVDTKSREAADAIHESERAEWQSKVADTMESFHVGGIDATHDEMLRKVQEASALNEAKMEMALSNVDSQGAKIEEDAQAIQAAELVKQFKLEMGVTPTEVSPEAIPTKTLGRNSVQV